VEFEIKGEGMRAVKKKNNNDKDEEKDLPS
jgi:hypothetical protein